MKFEASFINQLYGANGGKLMAEILTKPSLIKNTSPFWATRFKKDSQPTPVNSAGEAVFISKLKEVSVGSLMDMRAPLGESLPMDRAGEASYTDTIPNYIAKGFHETATERFTREQLWNEMDEENAVINFAQEVMQVQLDSANQTLSNMAAQLMSTGEIVYSGGDGIKGGVIKAAIPVENFVNAGVGAWNVSTTKILSQMAKIEEDYRLHTGYTGALVWDIPKQMFTSYFLTNDEVKDWYKQYASAKFGTTPTVLPILTRDMALEAIASVEGISPILIVEEKQRDSDGTIVSGWDATKAVLRPAGFAGTIKYANVLEESIYPKFGSNLISRNFAKALGGIATFMNSVHNNGNFKEWHTDLMMQAVPALNQFVFHYIVDTTTAD